MLLTPAAPPKAPAFNLNLEALRGVAAAVVVWHHVITYPRLLDPGYQPTGVGAYNPPGHFAVIIFFVLSGYVIGRRYPEPLPVAGIRAYLARRFGRIYPMYALAVLAGVVASGFTLPLASVGFHLLFWQGWGGVPVMSVNNALWSLPYEVLYYLAFVPLAVLAVPPWRVVAGAVALSLGALLLPGLSFSGLLAQYLIGFACWALGWALSTRHVSQEVGSGSGVLSALLLLLSLSYLDLLDQVGNRLADWLSVHQLPLSSYWVRNYFILPYAASIVLRLTDATGGGRWPRRASHALQLLPLAVLVSNSCYHWPLNVGATLVLPGLLYLLSLALYMARGPVVQAASCYVVQRLVALGAISYGLYIIHLPLLFLLGRVRVFSGSPLTFAVRALGYLLLVFLAATWLEKTFQPWAKQQLAGLLGEKGADK